MNLWTAIGVLSLISILPILWPLLRQGKPISHRLEHDLSVYRDQLREVDAELAADALTEKQAAEARREIERRILRAADYGQVSDVSTAPSAITAVLIALLLPALTLLMYLQIGQPTQPDQPLAGRDIAGSEVAVAQPTTLTGDQNDQIKDMVVRLAERLRDQPEDLDGWTLLGRSLAALGKFDEAANALRKAVDLSDTDAALLVAFGDIVTKAASGMITPEALEAFTKAQVLSPRNLAVRYFLALADLQAGRLQKAYDAWLEIYQELPAESSDNRQALAEQIRRVAQQLEINPENQLAQTAPLATSLPATRPAPGPDRAAMAQAENLSPAERQEFIQSMVQRLADRLEDEPDDFDGWMRLGKAYGVLDKTTKSAAAYGRAAILQPNNPAPLDAQAQVLIGAAPSGKVMPETTLAVLRQLEKLQPENSRTLWFLGMADAGAGRTKAAIGRWQRLYDLLPPQSNERASLKTAIDRLKAQ